MNYIAFDIGGSGGKAFLGRLENGKIALEEVHRFSHAPTPINGGLYWDIIFIYGELLNALQKAGRLTGGNITSIGIDSFCNDFGLVDKNGELLTPVRCYRDSRTEKYKDAIYAKTPPEYLYMRNGNQIAPFNTLMELSAMVEAGQGFLLENAYKLLYVPDLLMNFLTGAFYWEQTLASVSQLFKDGTVDDDIIGAHNIPKHIFAKVANSGTAVGRIKREAANQLGINQANGIAVCEHDTASAFIGAPVNGSIIISSGTWALVGVEHDGPIINAYGFSHNIANEGSFDRKHHRILKNVMGSWILQQMMLESQTSSGQQLSYERMKALIHEAMPLQHFIDVDDIQFFSPGGMIQKVKAACKEKLGASPATLGAVARCVSESLALKYRLVIEQLETLTQSHYSTINIIGGGSRDGLLCQFTANVTGRCVIAGPCDATAYGNILVQMIASGEISSIEAGRQLIKNSTQFTEYLPKDTGIWEAQYQAFKSAFSF